MDDVHRAHRLLSITFGLTWVSIALVAAPGPGAWVALSGDSGQAGVFFGIYALAAAAGAAVGGRLMDRFSRRGVLMGAHLSAATGFLVAGIAYGQGSLALFAVGTIILAAGAGAIFLTRLAAAEMFPPHERARAVARLQVMATFGAVLGPLLLIAAGPVGEALGRSADSLVWFVAPPLFVVAAILVHQSPEPSTLAKRIAPSGPSPSARAALPRAPVLAGVAALVCAQAAMVTIMGVAGAAMRQMHHSSWTIGLVMATHFVGMFALSTVVGRIADRQGRRATILAGLVTLGAGALGVAFLAGPVGLAVGLLFVGLGWSFAYIGGTVVLADVIPPARRGRFLGFTDFGTSIFAAAASFGGGWYYGGHGLPGLGLIALVVVAIPLVAALPLRESAPGQYDAPSASSS